MVRRSEELVDRFLDAIWMERGLSKNTLGAYRADLMTLGRGLSEIDKSIEQANKSDLLDFIAKRVESGAKPRSTARQLSSFRRFFRYIMREGMRGSDPTADIEMPRIGRSLPKSLSEDEVDALLNAPNTDEPLGHRDRAMLELLYATGLRVSELINLRQSQVNFNQGVLRIVGKGDRERLIPLGDESQRWLQEFIDGPRHDAPGVLAHHQALRREIRNTAKDVAPQPAARVRHTSAQSGRGPARGADVAGPQRSVDHPDLHTRGSRAPQRTARRAPPARLAAAARPGTPTDCSFARLGVQGGTAVTNAGPLFHRADA